MIRVLFSCIFLLTFLHDGTSQSIAAQEQALKNELLTPEQRIPLLNHLSRDMSFVRPLQALQLANEALELSTRYGNLPGQAYAYRNLGSSHAMFGSFYKSMEYLQQAIEIFEELKDSVGIGNCYISLGHLYRNLQNRELEIRYHKKAYDIFHLRSDRERQCVTAHNLGETYQILGDLPKARTLTMEALHIQDSLRVLPLLSACYKVMGMIEFQESHFLEAELYFKHVLEISDTLGKNSQKIATIQSQLQLAEICSKLNRHQEQLQWLYKAAAFSTESNLAEYLQTTYTQLIRYFTTQNETDSVRRYVNQFVLIEDSVKHRQLKDRSDLTGSVIQTYALEKDKRLLERDNLIQEQNLRKRTILLVAIVIFAIVMIWLVMKLTYANKQISKVNELLLHQSHTIEQQNHKLEVLNATKDKFFSIVAHDLKSPLNSLKMFSSLLQQQASDLTAEQVEELAGSLNDSVESTIEFADNIIAWAKLQMKEHTCKPELFIACDVLNEVCGLNEQAALAKGVQFFCQPEENAVVYADKQQLSFVIRNIVNNAVKFTRPGGFVHLRSRTLTDRNEILFEIQDTGIGIPPEIRATIFQIGKKISRPGTNGEKGTGIGLVLCHEFLQMNRGRLEIESTPEKGSKFLVYLPVKP